MAQINEIQHQDGKIATENATLIDISADDSRERCNYVLKNSPNIYNLHEKQMFQNSWGDSRR